MKNQVLFILLVILLVKIQEVPANVYAVNLRVTNPDGSVFDGKFNDGTGAKIWYRLNEHADTVKIMVKLNNQLVRDTIILNSTPGEKSWIWNGKNNLEAYAAIGNYTFSVFCSDAGHTKWDTLWTTGSDATGADLTGGTTYSYRGICLNGNMSSKLFGEAYVAYSTGWITEAIQKHLFITLNSDSTISRLLAETFQWNSNGFNEQPNDSAYRLVQPWYCELGADNKLYSSAQGRGEIVVINPETGDYMTSEAAPTQDIRGMCVYVKGTDTIFYWAQGTTGGVIKKKNGLNGAATDFYTPAGASNYMRDVAVDDEGNVYAAHSNGTTATTANRRLVKISPSGTLLWARDTTNSSPTGTEGGIRAICVSHGKNLQSAADDKVYIVCANSSSTSVNRHGIFEVNPINGDTKRVIRFPFNSVGSVSFDIACDAAGNLYLANGSDNRTVVAYSPSDGYNYFTTDAPTDVNINVITGINDKTNQPSRFSLEQNYPNPFNPSTTINYTVAKSSFVTLKVYDILGSELATLINETKPAGNYQVNFKADGLSSGVYFYKLTAGSFSEIKKMIYQK